VIRSVIFDLGGTLLDFGSGAQDWRSMEARGGAAFYRYLAEHGHVVPEGEFEQVVWDTVRLGWQEAMAGRGNACLPEMLGMVAAHFGISLSNGERMQAARVYASGVEDRLAMLEGASETLQQLQACGLRLGLLSNTAWPGEFHRQELERFGLIDFFDEMAFSCELGAWKPRAAAFHRILEQLNVAPTEAVYVGDLPEIDILGAQRAGLRAVWMAALPRQLGEVRPDATIQRLTELPAILECLEQGGSLVDR
jgi:putative hydrolase of the HAD superfamily